MSNNTFGERLFQKRRERKESRQKVANALGISRQSLEYYEKSKRRPDVDVIAKLAKYYGVSADYLLGFSDTYTSNRKERNEAKWIYDKQGNCFCENCKIRPAPIIPTRYCPNCGARMTNQGELHHKETESTNGVLK